MVYQDEISRLTRWVRDQATKILQSEDSYFDKVNRFLDLLLGVTAFCHNFAAQHGGETDEYQTYNLSHR